MSELLTRNTIKLHLLEFLICHITHSIEHIKYELIQLHILFNFKQI